MSKNDGLKITALLPFKNEEQFLPSYCSTVLKVVDNVVAIDDLSTDNSANILSRECKNNNVNLIIEKNSEDNVYYVDRIRKRLLQLGRDLDSTHFVCLDADESFTGNFIKNSRMICNRLQPGQKLTMQWLALWKSTTHYRDDNSVWSNSYKDFIFCEDKISNTHTTFIHENRTPGENTESNIIKLNNKYGAVFHYQFSAWKTFQMKQAWYRCREFVGKLNTVYNINEKYKITFDDNNVFLTKAPDEWVNNVLLPSTHYDYEKCWRYHKIKELINQNGVEYFKDLQIWHVPEIKKLSNVSR